MSDNSVENQFVFVCPMFNAQSKLATCYKLRDAVYMGKSVDKRRGCQACMDAGKCPAIKMAKILDADRRADRPTIEHFSTEPKVGKLHASVLERIAPIIVLDRHLDRRGVPVSERQMIRSANERIAAQLGSAPRALKSTPTRRKHEPNATVGASRTSEPVKSKTKTNAINQAARSGDLAAAINA